MQLKCSHCSKLFERDLGQVNQSKQRGCQDTFCSLDCFYRAKKIKHSIIVNCSNCGKKIIKTKSAAAKSKTGNLYCSRKCSASKNNTLFKSAENHPNYKNGISLYRKKALIAFEDLKCSQCGFKDIRALEVHHKDKNRKNNDLENLLLLCANCHKIIHSEDVV